MKIKLADAISKVDFKKCFYNDFFLIRNKIQYIILIYFFALFSVHCNPPEFSNICDTSSKKFYQIIFLKLLIMDKSSTCGFPSNLSSANSTIYAKEITYYTIPSLGIAGIINGTQISLSSNMLTSFTPLVASFLTTGKSVTISGIPQVSGKTSNSFSSNLVYTVTAQDGSTKNYTVTLTAPKIYGGGSLRIWVRTSSLGLNDGSQIATWSDESGYDNHFTQATAMNRPIFKKNQINGLPVARFNQANGTTMSVATPSASLYTDTDADRSGTFFIVIMTTGNASGQMIFNLAGVNGRQFDFSNATPPAFWQGRNGVGYNYLSTSFITLNSFVSIGSVMNAGVDVSELWNGDLKGHNVPSCCFTYVVSGQVTISNGQFNGDIAEVIYFNTPLSQNEVDKIFCYLRNKYNLTATTTSCGV